MDSNPPPLHQPGPLSLRRYGCLVILVLLIVLVIVALLLIRHVFVGTAVPFRILANLVQKANPNIKIEGISGDLSNGPSVKSITWGDDPANRSEILDLRVKYNGWANAKATKRIVIEDVGVKKAHIDLADFGPITRTTTTTSSSSSGRGPYSSSSSSSSPATDLGMDSIEVKQVLIEDVLITNRHSQFRLSIPKVSWTGFKLTKDTVEPGELVVESDRLTLHTVPGRTVPVGKESVTYQKTLNGTVQPLLHPAILQPINFTLDYSFVPEVKAPAFHFSTAEGKVEIDTNADGSRSLHVRHLNPGEFFDARKLYGKEAADFPSDLVFEATVAQEDGLLTIVSGNFRLGVTTFQIEPGEIAAADSGKAALRAVSRTGAGEIRWTLPLKDWPVECRPVFSSEPELEPKEILARVFAGKKYEELSVEEKQAVDARIPVYFSTIAP
jgi:hypothetical protein